MDWGVIAAVGMSLFGLIQALMFFVLNGIKTDVKETRAKISELYTWTENHYVSKEMFEAKMEAMKAQIALSARGGN